MKILVVSTRPSAKLIRNSTKIFVSSIFRIRNLRACVSRITHQQIYNFGLQKIQTCKVFLDMVLRAFKLYSINANQHTSTQIFIIQKLIKAI